MGDSEAAQGPMRGGLQGARAAPHRQVAARVPCNQLQLSIVVDISHRHLGLQGRRRQGAPRRSSKTLEERAAGRLAAACRLQAGRLGSSEASHRHAESKASPAQPNRLTHLDISHLEREARPSEAIAVQHVQEALQRGRSIKSASRAEQGLLGTCECMGRCGAWGGRVAPRSSNCAATPLCQPALHPGAPPASPPPHHGGAQGHLQLAVSIQVCQGGG